MEEVLLEIQRGRELPLKGRTEEGAFVHEGISIPEGTEHRFWRTGMVEAGSHEEVQSRLGSQKGELTLERLSL